MRCNIPILTVVLNNNFMAAETRQMATSYKLFGTQNIGGNYAEIGGALRGWAERVEDPTALPDALGRALRVVREERRQALLNVICKKP